MKKSLFFVATAALVLASCSNDVKIDENVALVGSNEQREIAFTPYAKTPKRAASANPEYNAVEGVAFPKNYDMKVVAYYYVDADHKGNYFGSSTVDEAPLFSLISSGEGAGYWGGKESTDKQYWPLYPATLNFLAVTNAGSPTADVVSETFGTPDFASQVTVTLSDNKPQSFNASDSLGQHDLMYAYGRASVTQNGNVLVIPQCVNMEFNHALAWVYFRVKAGNAASEAISIKGIKLKGANYAGTFVAAVDHYNSASDALAWTSATKWTAAGTSSENYSPNFSAQYNHRGASGEGDNDSKSLINGTFFNVGDGILVVPTYDLVATNSISSFDIEYYLNGTLCTYNYVPSELVYSKGKKYIYDITMTLHEIFVNASVADWDTDLNGNDTDDDDIMVDFPAVSTAHKTNLEITANEGGRYTVKVTGLGAAEAYTVAVGGTTSIITVIPVDGSADANGVATLTFNVKKTEGAATATITLDPETTEGTTVITVRQTAP